MQRSLTVVTAVCLMALTTHAQDKPGSKASPNVKIAKENPIGYFLGLSIGQQLAAQGLKLADVNPNAVAAGVADAIAQAESDTDLAMSDEEIEKAGTQLQQLITKRRSEFLDGLNKKATQWLTDNKKKEGIKELPGGLQYKVLAAGEGGSPTQSDKVKVHYTGRLTSGKVFDSSVQRGEPASFQVGGVIKGWQMALTNMKVGDKWMLYIPPALAYGERGSPGAIGPNEVLVFEVELLDIL